MNVNCVLMYSKERVFWFEMGVDIENAQVFCN